MTRRSSAPTAAAAIAMFAAALWCIPASATPSVPAAGVPGAAASAPMASVQVLGSTSIPATGRGVVPVHVLVLDAQGKSVPAGGIVRATIVHGSATFDITASPGAAYVTAPVSTDPAIDVPTDAQGTIVLPIAPGVNSGDLVVRLSTATLSRDVVFTLVGAVRKPLVVGYATVGAGPVPGLIESPDSAPNGTLSRRGAVDIFGTGEVAKNTTGTFAYNSTDVLQQSLNTGPFVDNPNDRPFPIYGDTSLRYDDALSQDRFYAQVQNGGNSALWGEFYAAAGPPTAIGGYNVLVSGARLRSANQNFGLMGFTAQNQFAYDRLTLSPTGLAISSQILQPDIIVGSDILTLVSLDRRTGAVVSQTLLVRGVDYVLDYTSGLLRFINVILPFDSNFNPQVVQVQYQYGGPGAKTTLTGADAALRFGAGNNNRIESWYLNNAQGSENLTLFGESISGIITGGNWSFSHEHSTGYVPVSQIQYGSQGDAYKAHFETKGGPFAFVADFTNTAAGYNNPYGNYTTPGLNTLSAKAIEQLGSKTWLELSYRFAKNQLPATISTEAVDNSDLQAEAKVRVQPNPRFSYHVGLRTTASASNGVVNPVLLYSGNAPQPSLPIDQQIPPFVSPIAYYAGEGHSFDADYGLSWAVTHRLNFSIDTISALSKAQNPFDPPQTQAELDLQVGDTGKAFVRQLWQSSPSEQLAATQTVPAYAGTAESSTMFGFEQSVGNATLDTGYAVDHTVNGTDLYDAIGVRQRFQPSQYLTGDAFGQVGQQLLATVVPTSGPSTPYFFVLGGSLNYARQAFHATTQVQVRTGFDGGSTFQVGATGPINNDISLFGGYTGSFTSAVYDSNILAGLSLRPSHNDRYVTLLSVDTQKSNLTSYDAYITNVAQLQQLYRPSTRTEFAASVAYKIQGDAYFAPNTIIYGIRADQRIGPRFDIGSEFHQSNIAPINGTSATGFAVEAGYRIGDQLRVATGYNFSGFVDPSTAVSPTHRGIYFTLSSYVDRIFGWGKE